MLESEFEEELERVDSGDPLTEKERKIFDIVKKHQGIITVRSIQESLGFSSSSVVFRYLEKLAKKKYIEKAKGYTILKTEDDNER